MRHRISVPVLLVDEHGAAGQQLYQWLTAADYEVRAIPFSDAGRAAQETDFAVGILATDPDEAAGLEALRDFRRRLPATRLIAIPPQNQPEAADQLLAAGADAVLTPPLQREAFLEKLEEQLAVIGIYARNEADFNRQLGARIRTHRLRQNRRLQQVAKIAGITAAQLSQIELGKTATTTWTLARICGALRLPPAHLFDAEFGRPPPHTAATAAPSISNSELLNKTPPGPE